MYKTNISVVVFLAFACPQVTIDVELCLNTKTKLKSSRRPAAKYDVYLYRTPQTKTKTQVPNGDMVKTVSNGPSRTKGRVLRWEDDCYPPSPPCSTCRLISVRSQQPKPRTAHPYHLWQSLSVPVPADDGRVSTIEQVGLFLLEFGTRTETVDLLFCALICPEHHESALGSGVLSHQNEISAFIQLHGIFLHIVKHRETLNITTCTWRHHSSQPNNCNMYFLIFNWSELFHNKKNNHLSFCFNKQLTPFKYTERIWRVLTHSAVKHTFTLTYSNCLLTSCNKLYKKYIFTTLLFVLDNKSSRSSTACDGLLIYLLYLPISCSNSPF